jgi:hypothetical protein
MAASSLIDFEFEELEVLLPPETDKAAYTRAIAEFDLRESDAESALRSLRVSLVGTSVDSKIKAVREGRYRMYCARLATLRKACVLGTPSARVAVANDATARAEASHALLVQASRQLADAIENGEQTIVELDRQGRQIQGTRNKLAQVNTELSYSNRLLSRMSQWFR